MKTYLPRFLLLASMSSLFVMSGYATVIESLPFTITKAGTYTLDGNLKYTGAANTDAITVTASNVILDLNGHRRDLRRWRQQHHRPERHDHRILCRCPIRKRFTGVAAEPQTL
jgi:hypothetical protein